MRINKAVLAAFVIVSAASQPVESMSPETLNAGSNVSHKAVGKNKAASARVQEVDNSGRQLALAIPGLGVANISLSTPVVKPITKSDLKGKAINVDSKFAVSRSGNNITVKVPKSVDETIDYAHVASKQMAKLANEGGTQLANMIKWVGMYLKQFNQAPTVTPSGYPYVQAPTQIAAGHKLYLTRDGRLKTVVKQ